MQSLQSTETLRPVLTVSQLTAQIRELLEEVFDNIYVVGEVSNAKVYPSGHWYFSLKDKEATLPCVCFRNSNSNLKFKLEDGLMIVVRGKLSVYPPRGAYQMVALSIEPVGIGDWQLAFDQLKRKLDGEGLLDPARKRPIPLLPRTIGVVTSPAAAALRDILSAIRRRNKNVNVVISPTRVQGEGSADEIAQSIYALQELPNIEVIIIARGGGSIEDLWSFNTEVVARAVAESRIPTISGVGHETDITICDLVADLRAPTPTAAAELVAAGYAELFEKWSSLVRHLRANINERVMRARQKLDRVNALNQLIRFSDRLKHEKAKLVHTRQFLLQLISQTTQKANHQWHQNHQKLLALSPTNVLNRGFSILQNAEKQIVRSANSVKPGDYLEALLASGKLVLQVISCHNTDHQE